MSLIITKSGLLDTIQDAGRFGYAHAGINPSGAMDILAMKTANALAGNAVCEAVMEMHFPAAAIACTHPALMAISGADFDASIECPDGETLAVAANKTFFMHAGSSLVFKRKIWGERCYLAMHGGFALSPWLGSLSTNTKIGRGGYHGRALKREDQLVPKHTQAFKQKGSKVYPWVASINEWYQDEQFFIIPGPEWDWLETASKNRLLKDSFSIAPQSDRMGILLKGISLQQEHTAQLVSGGVSFGTMQLLPSGQVMILGADHPTTGGYPRIANIISAHLPRLAQAGPGANIRFTKIAVETANNLLIKQHSYAAGLQQAMKFKLSEILV